MNHLLLHFGGVWPAVTADSEIMMSSKPQNSGGRSQVICKVLEDRMHDDSGAVTAVRELCHLAGPADARQTSSCFKLKEA